MAEYKSERTKKIEKSKVDKDMSPIKKVVRATALGVSRAADKVEGFFKKEEPKKMAKGGMSKKDFKPCKDCPHPAKCKAAGKCLMKEGKPKKAAEGMSKASKGAAGMLVIPVKMEKSTPTKYAGADKKKPAKKKAK